VHPVGIDCRSTISSNAVFFVSILVAVDVALASPTWSIDNEQGCVEASGGSADLALQALHFGNRHSKVLCVFHHVTRVDIIRLDIDTAQFSSVFDQRLRVIVDAEK